MERQTDRPSGYWMMINLLLILLKFLQTTQHLELELEYFVNHLTSHPVSVILLNLKQQQPFLSFTVVYYLQSNMTL